MLQLIYLKQTLFHLAVNFMQYKRLWNILFFAVYQFSGYSR